MDAHTQSLTWLTQALLKECINGSTCKCMHECTHTVVDMADAHTNSYTYMHIYYISGTLVDMYVWMCIQIYNKYMHECTYTVVDMTDVGPAK